MKTLLLAITLGLVGCSDRKTGEGGTPPPQTIVIQVIHPPKSTTGLAEEGANARKAAFNAPAEEPVRKPIGAKQHTPKRED